MISKTPDPKPAWHRYAWFVGLWVVGVIVISLVAGLIRLLLPA